MLESEISERRGKKKECHFGLFPLGKRTQILSTDLSNTTKDSEKSETHENLEILLNKIQMKKQRKCHKMYDMIN